MQDALNPFSQFMLNFFALGEPGLYGFYWILQLGAIALETFYSLFGLNIHVVPV